jgi:hypothetical protein
MAGQNHHFGIYAPEKIPYAIERYVKETNRLYGVLDRRLAQVPFVAGQAYTIADMAIYPWIVPWERQQQRLADFPHLSRWFAEVAARPATVRAYAVAQTEPFSGRTAVTEAGKKLLFGQTAASVAPGPEAGSVAAGLHHRRQGLFQLGPEGLQRAAHLNRSRCRSMRRPARSSARPGASGRFR